MSNLVPLNYYHLHLKSTSFQGILKFTICSQYHNFCIKVDLYKIIGNGNNDLIDLFVKSCTEDPTNQNLCELISTELQHEEILSLQQVEKFLMSINKVKSYDINSENIQNMYNINLGKLKVIMNLLNIKRLYDFFESFTRNYVMMGAIYNMILKLNPQGQKQIEEQVITKKEEIIPEKKIILEPEIEQNRTELDTILDLCLTPSIKSSVIHYMFTYYRFIDPKYCKIVIENNKIDVYAPILFPAGFIFDQEYFESLALSNENLNFEKVNYSVKKLLSLYLSANESIINNSLYIMAINYLIFVYFIKYMSDFHPDKYKYHLTTYMTSGEFQTNIFNHYVKTIDNFKDVITFHISDINDQFLTDNIDTINKLSDEYQHLVSVSPAEFIDMVFNNIKNKKKPEDFQLNHTRILDLTKIINKDSTTINSLLFDSSELSGKIDYSLFNYKENDNNGIITKEYDYFLKYLEDPSTLLIIDDKDLDKDLKLLFDLMSKSIINKLNMNTNDLIQIYNMVLDELPHPEQIKHNIILKVIYNIIVPHLYKTYSTTKFVDYFTG